MARRTLRHFIVALAGAASLAASLHPAIAAAPAAAGGSVKLDKTQQFAGISVQIPTGFTKKDETRDKMQSPIPGAPGTTETFRSYVNGTGQGIFFFHWDGTPQRDRGPMAAAESWEVPVDGQKARVSRTSLFLGQAKQVLVAHFTGPAPAEHHYMIYTTVVDKAAFTTLLSSIHFEARAAGKAK